MQLSANPAEQARETRFVEVVFPGLLSNHYGTLFGGDALKRMGKAAFVAATLPCTLQWGDGDIRQDEFHKPIPVGKLVEIVERGGRSSMTVCRSR
jgi:acyl-CoA hydrolase